MDQETIKGVPHYVYDSEDEFRITHPDEEIMDWKTASEGSWVWSDDNRIVQILKRGSMTMYGRPTTYVRTVVGTFVVDPKYTNGGKGYMDTDFSKHKNRYRVVGKTNPDRDRDTTFISSKERRFIREIIRHNFDYYKAHRIAFPTAKSPNYIEKHIRGLLTEERILMAIREEVGDAAAKANFSLVEVFKSMRTMLKDENTSDKAKVDLINTSLEVFDAYPSKTVQGASLGIFEQITVSPDELDAAAGVGQLGEGQKVLPPTQETEQDHIQDQDSESD